MQKYIIKIKEEREKQGITIKELCLQADVTETTYFNLMAGKNIGIFTFFEFLEILKIQHLFLTPKNLTFINILC